MNSSNILGERDRSKLSALLHHKLPGLIPHPKAYETLRNFIHSSHTSEDEATLQAHISLGDQVIISSPRHTRSVRVVLPEEAREGTERISVLSPQGLAILGKKVGSTITWSTATGTQEVMIREVLKEAYAPVCFR